MVLGVQVKRRVFEHPSANEFQSQYCFQESFHLETVFHFIIERHSYLTISLS